MRHPPPISSPDYQRSSTFFRVPYNPFILVYRISISFAYSWVIRGRPLHLPQKPFASVFHSPPFDPPLPCAPIPFSLEFIPPPSFILRPSSFILRPSSFILRPSS